MEECRIKQTEDFDLIGGESEHWKNITSVELLNSVNGRSVENKAKAKMMWSKSGLYLLYVVEDDHIWGNYKNDDDPIYNEEVVEAFIGEGKNIPTSYYEFQFSPNGVKFDAKIENPTGNRSDEGFKVDVNWNAENLKFSQQINAEESDHSPIKGVWNTEVFIPWKDLGMNPKRGDYLRVNLFRIDGYPKQDSFQSWIPTLKDPPNFHVPEKFALLELVD